MRALRGRRRALRSLFVLGAPALAITLTPLGAIATSAPAQVADGSRPIAVSVPPDPVVLVPGQTSEVLIRVVNPGSAPVTVTVTGRELKFGDDGKVEVTDTPDPKWQGRVDFPAGNLTIAAEDYIDVLVTVRMPDQIDPDLYFIGFVVSPVPSGDGSVVVINQIGAFFTIDVPGPRVRKLTADLTVSGFDFGPIHLSSVVVGSETDGELRVHNVGRAHVRFWGENDTTSWPGGETPTQQRIEKSLLPIGASRSVEVVGKPTWPVGFVTYKVHIVYPDKTDTATAEIILTKRMLVIHPWVIVAACVLTALAVYWWLRRGRRRRPVTRRPPPRGKPSSAPASRSPKGAHPGNRRGTRRRTGAPVR